MHKKYLVRLSDEARQQLTALTRKGAAAASKIRHVHMLLKADAKGLAGTDEKIAAHCAVSINTVLGVRQRLVEQGREAVLTRKKQARPSRIPRLDGAGEARLRKIKYGAGGSACCMDIRRPRRSTSISMRAAHNRQAPRFAGAL